MTTFYILAGLFVFFLICYLLLKKFTDKSNGTGTTHIQQPSVLTEDQYRWEQTVGRLFRENYAMELRDVYVKCGMPYEIAYSKDSELIQQYIPFEKGSVYDNIINTYALAISRRYDLINFPLIEIPAKNYGLSLKNSEHIYHRINSVGLFQEKTTKVNFVYSGMRWQSGFLRTGTMNVIGNEITRFVQLDIGRLIFTNKRLIYIGAQKNVTKDVPLANILYTTIYKDGVMVHQANKKPVLFKFSNYKEFEIFQIDDGLFEFMTVLERLKSHTEMQDLLNEKSEVVSEVNKEEVAKALEDQGYDILLLDVINFFKDKGVFGTSTIARNFGIGYSRALNIKEQLISLNLVRSNKYGQSELLYDNLENVLDLLKKAL